MWKDNIPWSREIKNNMKMEFLNWFEELSSLKNLFVSRCFSHAISGQHGISIHTFCDASQFANAAAVFIRIEYADIHVNPLAAKLRVPPVTTTNIPRLELLAATVGARACTSVIRAHQRYQVVERLIMTEHKKNSHARLQMLLNVLREHYWILNARKTVRSVLSKCVICLRHAKRNVTTPSASLPENRIKDFAVFEITGFGLAGTLYLKGGSKEWICIYTCAVFRAVHFELFLSLTTEAFLQSFRRFIARRGRPSIVYCDNGGNFIGASNYFKSVNWPEIAQFSSMRRMQWLFNPPTASWRGGFWERLVGVIKHILRRVLGKAFLPYEEMITVLCNTESIINSREYIHASEKDSERIHLSHNSFWQDFRQIGVPDLDQVDEVVLN
ncbi:hypothetical protein AVEN_152936-1 [Araneus ventricosus]|uniref:Integrase catalytic domain-containing protein n=1 Tax=Araneus ventricosus TaxID=182803 RepID=A0A4Y2AD82_ARAVE|nr:hypothetical protein AVEN_152936-1 [Araneus ventricosus]